MEAEDAFEYRPDPENPGWYFWSPRTEETFNALYDPMRVRPEEPGKRARVRITPQSHLKNLMGAVHGGGILGFIDIALFAGARACGYLGARTAVTLELSTQFVGAARPGVPLDAVVELIRETGRMVFLRGTLEQEDEMVASFIATLRKGR